MRTPAAVLALTLVLCSRVPLLAQPVPASATDARGQRVSAIQILVDGVASRDPVLAGLLDVAVGQPLDPSRVRSSIEHLVHLRRFATVDILAEPDATGVVVRVELTSARRVGDVRVEGALRAVGDDIARAVHERIGSGALTSQTTAAVDAAQDALGEHGYLRPQIATRLDATDRRDVMRLVMTGDPGPRWQVARVSITGLPAAEHATALAALDLVAGMPYDRADIDARTQRYTNHLRTAGGPRPRGPGLRR